MPLVQWNIVWVDWPHDEDPKVTEPHAGILISRQELIDQDALYLLYVTSTKRPESWCVEIDRNKPWFRATGLQHTSYCYVRRSQLFRATDILPGVPGIAPVPLQLRLDGVMKSLYPNLFHLAHGPLATPPSQTT